MAPGQVLSCCSRPLSSAFAPTHSLGIRWCPLHTGHVSDGVAQSLPQQKAEDGADFTGCWKAYRLQLSCGLAPRRPSAKGRFTGICHHGGEDRAQPCSTEAVAPTTRGSPSHGTGTAQQTLPPPNPHLQTPTRSASTSLSGYKHI